jgi:hypothetical protein
MHTNFEEAKIFVDTTKPVLDEVQPTQKQLNKIDDSGEFFSVLQG